MIDSERHPYVEYIAREARRPVVIDPAAARERIMAAVRAEPLPRRRSIFWERVVAPRSFTLSPVTSSLIAAGLIGIGVLAGALASNGSNRDGRATAGQDSVASRLPVSDTVVRF